MLMSLIAVLVLLVIGFYAVIVGAVGRAAVGDGALSPAKRLGMMALGLVALVLAYLSYSYPLGRNAVEGLPQDAARWDAMPSNPPESRGDSPAAATPVAVAEPSDNAAELLAAVAADAAQETVVETAAAPAAAPGLASAPVESGLSATAAAMEAELLRRRQGLSPLPADATTPEPPPAAAVAAAPSPAPVARQAARSPARPSASRVTTPRPLPSAYAPLTIVIHNQLGERQQRETLSLLIEGRRVASFEITEATPVIELPVRLPRPGLVHYRLEGESGQGRPTALSGQGCISAVDGARFHVRRQPGSQRVFLESSNG